MQSDEITNTTWIRFGAFEYDVDAQTLFRNAKRITLGARAHALFHTLAFRLGQVVSNSELTAAAWPATHVDPTNLRVQIAALRRALSDRKEEAIITTVSGHGYRLNAETVLRERRPVVENESRKPVGLIAPLTPIRGRSETVSSVLDKLSKSRLVSIVGPGGIGKTRVAIDACWRLADRSVEVCFVDLAPLTAPEFVASAISTALELTDGPAASSLDKVLLALRGRAIVIALDNCEHVVDEVARVAETLLTANPLLKLLATSREPINIAGEVSVRIGGLAIPDASFSPSTLEHALEYPAIELLVERAVAASDDLVFSDDHVPHLIGICRKLDCIPLAIELAAPRLAAFGARQLLDNLDSQLITLGEGRRASSVRHRTLKATLEWSYSHLSDEERLLLTRLAVFRSAFPLSAATALSLQPEAEALMHLSGLVDKSLVVVERSGSSTTYRLLETTRSFAEEKLNRYANSGDVRLRHARYIHSIFSRSAREDGSSETAGDMTYDYRRLIDDVRSAIAWALGHAGESSLAIKLIVDSAPIWFVLSILPEYASIIAAAAELLWDPTKAFSSEARWLVPSLHLAHYDSLGLVDRLAPMLLKALEESEQAGDAVCALNCLYPLFGTRLTQGRYDEALGFARRFSALASKVDDELQRAMSDRIVALSLWRSGEFRQATDLSTAAITGKALAARSPVILPLIYKQGVAARGNFSSLLWLQGRADQALALADEAIEVGLREDVIGLCYTLAHTLIPLSFWTGKIERAEAEIELLLTLSKDSGLGLWQFWAQCYESLLRRSEDGAGSVDFIEENLSRVDGLHRHILATIAPDTARSWLLPSLDSVLSEPGHWCSAELQRAAVMLSRQVAPEAWSRNMLLTALRTAEKQGALAWQLRISTSIAEFAESKVDREASANTLESVLGSFAEGEDTRDITRARQMLDQLRNVS